MGRPKGYEVHLSQEERNHLIELLTGGTNKVRVIKRAQVLLKANDGWTDRQIAEALPVGEATVGRIRQRCVEGGLVRALYAKRPEWTHRRKVDGEVEARLIALVSGSPPEGHKRWTLRLLAERLVLLEEVPLESISYETVRQVLKKTSSSLGVRGNG